MWFVLCIFNIVVKMIMKLVESWVRLWCYGFFWYLVWWFGFNFDIERFGFDEIGVMCFCFDLDCDIIYILICWF